MPPSELNWDKYINLLRKHKRLFFVTALSVMTMAVLISYLLPSKYEAKSTVFIEKNVISDLVKGIAVSPDVDDSLKVMQYAMTSRALLLKTINNVDFNMKNQSDAAVGNLIDEIRQNITISTNGKDPNMFIVAFRYYNPRVARDFVNTLVQLFIEQNLSAKRDQSYGAGKFLQEEMAAYKDRLDKAQAAINQFKERQGSVAAIDSDRLLHDIDTAQQRLAELDLRKRQLQQEQIYEKNAADPLRVKLTALTRKLAELRSQFTDNFPEIIDLKSQIQSLQKEIASGGQGAIASGEQTHKGTLTPQQLWKIEAELKAIDGNEAVIQRYIDKDKELLASIPNAKAVLDKLEDAKSNEQNMYNLLALRQDQSEISTHMEVQDKSTTFRIIDPAVTPLSPVSPNRRKIMLLGIFAGLAAGAGLLLAIDYIDHSVKTVDAMKTFGLPVLAVVPLIRQEDEIQADKKNDLRVYLLSGAYFSLILAVLAMEVLGIPAFQNIMSGLHLPPAVVKFLERL